jgi:1-aminocyclopropane-1-carboxylate deaminase/D-cysteine desulfhydrase-like pyridoxal-dependent ACC family enzyme
MDLEFLSREDYLHHSSGSLSNPGEYLIPQGGYGLLGVKGAAEMLNFTDKGRYTHICCACGTGTMMAGLISSYSSQGLISPEKPGTLPHFVGIAVVKDPHLRQNVENLVQPQQIPFTLLFDYQFGGYAKKTDALIHFMNSFFRQHYVPTDFVYTGKLMFGIKELFNSGFFPDGSRILAIHSGGLQGNKSLKKGTLLY